MATTWQAAVQPTVAEILRDHGVPGAVIAVARGGRPAEYLTVGTDGRGRPLAEDSLVAVASITKLATALAVLRLVDTGAFGIDDLLDRYVPEAAAAQPGVTLRRLLTHTSGLLGGYEQELGARTLDLSWPAIARAAQRVPPGQPPGMSVEYSNLNYCLLASVVERVTGKPFAIALRELVLAPLGVEGYFGVEPPRPPAYVGGLPVDEYTGTPLEQYNTPFDRAIGRPNAGLVVTAAGALALVHAFRGMPVDFLAAGSRAAATRDQTGGLGGGFTAVRYERCPWGLGPELRGDKSPHWAPAKASPESFGHYGATGCLVWADPRSNVTWAILGSYLLDGLTSRTLMSSIGGAVLTAAGKNPLMSGRSEQRRAR
jgi:CubicO group peptidase (beta-lactamase class C family)